MKRAIETKSAPAAIGPYSQAVVAGAMVFCSGQIGLDPQTSSIVSGGIEAETRRVLANIREVLAAAKLELADVVKTTIFLADLRDFDLVNRIYGEHFEPPFPARSTVQAAALPRGARIEIEVIAMKPPSSSRRGR
ncbi:MAG: RidA family protein [Candidatus Binataceae bacterium]